MATEPDLLAKLRRIATRTAKSQSPSDGELDAIYDALRYMLVWWRSPDQNALLIEPVRPILLKFAGPDEPIENQVDAMLRAAVAAAPVDMRNAWRIMLLQPGDMVQRLRDTDEDFKTRSTSTKDNQDVRTNTRTHQLAQLLVLAIDRTPADVDRAEVAGENEAATSERSRGTESVLPCPITAPETNPPAEAPVVASQERREQRGVALLLVMAAVAVLLVILVIVAVSRRSNETSEASSNGPASSKASGPHAAGIGSTASSVTGSGSDIGAANTGTSSTDVSPTSAMIGLGDVNTTSGGQTQRSTTSLTVSTPAPGQPPSTAPHQTNPTTVPQAPTTTAPAKPTLIFSSLGGGSSIIQVYQGPGESAADRTVTGTFSNEDTVTAECKRSGRDISSHPEDGELARTSDQWILIEGTPGVRQWATAVYTENFDQLQASLTMCPSV